jgi:cation-transporting P-type ATPase 13A2
MENKLKKQTIPALKALNKAEIASIMVTGDNILTGCFIASTCGITDPEKPLYLSESMKVLIIEILQLGFLTFVSSISD